MASIQPISKVTNERLTKRVTSAQPAKPTVQLKVSNKVPTKTETVSSNKPRSTLKAKTVTKKEDEKAEIPSKINNVRRSVDLEKSDESSLYVSALEEVPEENVKRVSRSSKVYQ